jgi:hypothetical protein
MSQGLAPVATNVWNKGLYDKMKDIITSDNPASQSDREKWNKIFAYYNIPVNVVTESNTNETNEAPLEYE